jgi:ribonuclease HII
MKNAAQLGPVTADGSAGRVSLFDDIDTTRIGLDFERLARANGFKLVAGIDEVGRGCIAGPVVAAACILDPDDPLHEGIDDSKKLAPELRTEIADYLKENAMGYAIGEADAEEIDTINILEATKRAMLRAIEALSPSPDFLLIDALTLKGCTIQQRAIIKGDSISASIAAASILAKTYRDDLMKAYDREFPGYGFASHKGYGCRMHYDAVRELGPCRIHRKTFRGVRPEQAPMLF